MPLTPVILSDAEGATRTEAESKLSRLPGVEPGGEIPSEVEGAPNPENASVAMLFQGVRPEMHFRCRTMPGIDLKENSLYHRAMKKAKHAPKTSALKRRAAKAKASSKSKSTPKTVDEYFAAVPEPARSALHQIREAIRSVVPPEATEIISYKIPAFRHKKVLVWYAAFSNHCSLFPTAAVIERFKDELKDFSTSKGTIHFPTDKPMPVGLIKKLVLARVARP